VVATTSGLAETLARDGRAAARSHVTSGLPDDSREADERVEERNLHDLRGRVKAARAAISTTPGAEEALRQSWVKAACFFVSFGISEDQFRRGVPDDSIVGEASSEKAELKSLWSR